MSLSHQKEPGHSSGCEEVSFILTGFKSKHVLLDCSDAWKIGSVGGADFDQQSKGEHSELP